MYFFWLTHRICAQCMPSVQSRSPWRSHFVEHTFSDQLIITAYMVSSSWRGKNWQLLYLILAGQSLQVLHCTFKSEKKARRWKHHLIKLFTGIQSCIINVNCPEIWVQKSPLKWVNRDCFCDIMQLCRHFGNFSFILTCIFFFYWPGYGEEGGQVGRVGGDDDETKQPPFEDWIL